MASSGGGGGSGMSAQKMANLQAILKWSLNETAKEIAREKEKEKERAASSASGEEGSTADEGASSSTRNPKMMSEERRNFLMEAMASMTEDTAQVLEDAGAVLAKPDLIETETAHTGAKARDGGGSGTNDSDIATASTAGATEAEKIKALEEIRDRIDDLDNSRNLHLVGGLVPVIQALRSRFPEVRWRAADALGTCVQNNPDCQQWAFENQALEYISFLSLHEVEVKPVSKALYALSCLLRGHEASVTKAFLTENEGKTYNWTALEGKDGLWRELAEGEGMPRGAEVSLNFTTGKKWLKFDKAAQPDGWRIVTRALRNDVPRDQRRVMFMLIALTRTDNAAIDGSVVQAFLNANSRQKEAGGYNNTLLELIVRLASQRNEDFSSRECALQLLLQLCSGNATRHSGQVVEALQTTTISVGEEETARVPALSVIEQSIAHIRALQGEDLEMAGEELRMCIQLVAKLR